MIKISLHVSSNQAQYVRFTTWRWFKWKNFLLERRCAFLPPSKCF